MSTNVGPNSIQFSPSYLSDCFTACFIWLILSSKGVESDLPCIEDHSISQGLPYDFFSLMTTFMRASAKEESPIRIVEKNVSSRAMCTSKYSNYRHYLDYLHIRLLYCEGKYKYTLVYSMRKGLMVLRFSIAVNLEQYLIISEL